ncbi:hypothetical protein KKH23_07105 [Patescibacteria group bacterium]|nr:hypothetical protein [Patescibacteria group bacterium]
MKNLEITQEKVIEAANKCPQAKDVLKTLFPEAFGSIKNKCINLQALSLKGGSHPQVFSSAGLQGIGAPLNSFMEIRSTGEIGQWSQTLKVQLALYQLKKILNEKETVYRTCLDML